MEQVYYEKGDVKVTNTMYTVGNSSYPLSQIAAVRFETKTQLVRIPGDPQPMGCFGALIAIMVGGFGLLIGGFSVFWLLLLIGGIIWGFIEGNNIPSNANYKETLKTIEVGYSVVIQTSGGSFSTFDSRDKAEPQAVHEALNTALAAR